MCRICRIRESLGRGEGLCGTVACTCLKQDGQDMQDEQDKRALRMLMSEAGWPG